MKNLIIPAEARKEINVLFAGLLSFGNEDYFWSEIEKLNKKYDMKFHVKLSESDTATGSSIRIDYHATEREPLRPSPFPQRLPSDVLKAHRDKQ